MSVRRFLPLLTILIPLAGQTPATRSVLERLKPERLEAVQQQRLEWVKHRASASAYGVYQDFRAVMHIHAEDAPHTKGTREELLKGAKVAQVQVVLSTDHRGPKEDSWRGLHEGVLFIQGSEDDHMLRYPATDAGPEMKFLSHLEERPNMAYDGFTGTEIYNRHTDAVVHKEFHEYLQKAMKDPKEWGKLVNLQKRYPDEVFAAGTDVLPGFLEKWDRITQTQVFTGVAANDAHQNQIFNDVVFDRYYVALRHASTHILARELTEADIRESLREGRAYVSHDWLCDPTGFTFVANNNLGVFDMGDHIPMQNNTRLTATLPLPAKIKLIRNGKVIAEAKDSRFQYTVKEEGAYRLEAWLTIDGEDRPWIFANPIFVAKADPLRLPPTEISPAVTVKKDLPYTQGKPEDAAKHKLDVYSPATPVEGGAPVLFFVHGGSWRSGDRSNYGILGNRFALDGLVVVIPSYRLAPKDLHPAQITDVADAFAWTYKHAAEFGGDPKKIYIAGHSAGGHLVALLATDEKYLKAAQVPDDAIKGVAALSGVYDVRGLENVFGVDEMVRRDASPAFHVRKIHAPFLVTYCQWDYGSLPAQARQFDSLLRRAFVSSRLLFIPKESHISEIVSVMKKDDPTAQAILKLIRGTASPSETK